MVTMSIQIITTIMVKGNNLNPAAATMITTVWKAEKSSARSMVISSNATITIITFVMICI